MLTWKQKAISYLIYADNDKLTSTRHRSTSFSIGTLVNRYHDVLGDYYLEDAEIRRIIMPHVNLAAYTKRFQMLADCEVFTG